MIAYCDRLTVRSCARIVLLRLRSPRRSGWLVRVLDAPPRSGLPKTLTSALWLAGIGAEQAEFFAGRLLAEQGMRIPTVAGNAAIQLAFAAAEQLVGRSPVLSDINAQWRRDTVLLHIAKGLWLPFWRLTSRVLVTASLARDDDRRPLLVLHIPAAIDPRWLQDRFEHVDLKFCTDEAGPVAGVVALIGAATRAARTAVTHLLRKARGRRDGAADGGPTPSSESARGAVPGLLVLQQDDLGLDRSYRTQPHWLLPEMGRLGFRTYILQKSYVRRSPYPVADLAARGVFVLQSPFAHAMKRSPSDRAVHALLRRDVLRCVVRSFARSAGPERAALWATCGLLARAWVLARLCARLNIRAFVSGEHFLVEADAMQVVAPHLGIKTLSYQYSNLARTSPVMMTTADTMLTFSSSYDAIWVRGSIRPGKFVANGYVFDSSFEFVRERARRQRQTLAGAGASFVVCYFDETVLDDKYGLIHPDDHREEILSLVRLVLEDSTCGLVVKTQYRRNSPSRLYAGDPELEAAKRSGRYVELLHGTHRNTVFPSEAALVADLTIGHVFGATASLEAALAGRRSIMLNSYCVTGEHDHLYSQANIVYASLQDALGAVKRYRAGDPSQASLGDWSPILHHFDPFRDGNAGRRMRRMLDEIMSQDVLSTAGGGKVSAGLSHAM